MLYIRQFIGPGFYRVVLIFVLVCHPVDAGTPQQFGQVLQLTYSQRALRPSHRPDPSRPVPLGSDRGSPASWLLHTVLAKTNMFTSRQIEDIS